MSKLERAAKQRRRTLDRSVDIEYYTNESLGPSRKMTPEGFLVCFDVPIARTGDMVYGPGEVPEELGIGRDGRILIHRTPKAVFDQESMASINGKPITDDHPPVDVDPKNWRFYTRGVVMSPRRGTGEYKDCLVADIMVYDEDTIRDIDLGKREVSCGYNPDYVQYLTQDGRPVQGVGEQINILYNHLALVERGRCGERCSIRDHKTVDRQIILPEATIQTPKSFWSERRMARLERALGRLERL